MFTKQAPGTIVPDFNAIVIYIFKNKILVKGKGRQFPIKLLETLNHLLIHPLKHGVVFNYMAEQRYKIILEKVL